MSNDITDDMRKAIHGFYTNFGRNPDRLLLSPRKWQEFVNLTFPRRIGMDCVMGRMRCRDAGEPVSVIEFMGVRVDIAQLVTFPEITAVLDSPGDQHRMAEIRRAEEKSVKTVTTLHFWPMPGHGIQSCTENMGDVLEGKDKP